MRKKLKYFITAVLMLGMVHLLALEVSAQSTLKVPADFPFIQHAINAAVDGDTVVVGPGTYKENIDFLGKAITVTSEQGAELTIIDGNRVGSAVIFSTGEGQGSVIRGFTIQNGFARGDVSGGGIRIRNSSPRVENNIITSNTACQGAGVSIIYASPIIQENVISNNRQAGCSGGFGGGISIIGSGTTQILNNVISDNYSGGDGGGLSLWAAGAPVIKGNTIQNNSAGKFSSGGGIVMSNFSNAEIVQNLITGNSAGSGGGVYWLVPSGARGPRLMNNIISGNFGTQGSEVYAGGFDAQVELVNNIVTGSTAEVAVYCGDYYDRKTPIFRFNDLFNPVGPSYGGICTDQTGLNGNLSADPLFVDPAGGDYHLQAGSPAIDSGDSPMPDLPDTDFDENPRVSDGNGDGWAQVDIGAYEFVLPAFPFSDLEVRILLLKGNPRSDFLTATGSFTLGIGSNGVNPVGEKVVLSFSDTNGKFFKQTIPPGSFRKTGRSFFFKAPSGRPGISLMSISPNRTAGQYTFFVIGQRLNLKEADQPPVTVSLQIGDDAGSQKVSCPISHNMARCW